jgi:two-component system alkaline phosphatase synthesis response regulator PhoP
VTPAPARVLVVEDDLSILTGVSMNLKFEGYDVLQAQDGRQGLQRALDDRPDLMILDIMLPSMNGFEVLGELRQRGIEMPVLLLSAKGLEKPFGLQELLARVKALLRRRTRGKALVVFSDTEVDLEAKVAVRGGKPVDLTAQEFRLLEHFVQHPGRTFNRNELLSGAWGFEYEGTFRTVDNFVRQLRLKLEPDPDEPRHFLTVRGLGYRFER